MFSNEDNKDTFRKFLFFFENVIRADSNGGYSQSIKITIINDYKNLVDIDFNINNIERKKL